MARWRNIQIVCDLSFAELRAKLAERDAKIELYKEASDNAHKVFAAEVNAMQRQLALATRQALERVATRCQELADWHGDVRKCVQAIRNLIEKE